MTKPTVDINLTIGFPLQIHIESMDESFRTHIVGKEPGRFLIVKKPDALDGEFSLAEGTRSRSGFCTLGKSMNSNRSS